MIYTFVIINTINYQENKYFSRFSLFSLFSCIQGALIVDRGLSISVFNKKYEFTFCLLLIIPKFSNLFSTRSIIESLHLFMKLHKFEWSSWTSSLTNYNLKSSLTVSSYLSTHLVYIFIVFHSIAVIMVTWQFVGHPYDYNMVNNSIMILMRMMIGIY